MGSPSVVLIVIDTLRRDYGEKYLNSILEKRGFVYYPNAVAPSPWTTPTHASIFTGLYPSLHGVHETRRKKSYEVRLRARDVVWRDLAMAGYVTYLFSANIFISPYFGFEGFDKFHLSNKRPPNLISANENKLLQLHSKPSSFQIARSLIRSGEYKLLLKSAIQKVFLNNRFVVNLYSVISKWPLDMGISEFIHLISKIKTDKPVFLTMNLMEMHEPYPTLKNSAEINYHTIKSWVGKSDRGIIHKYRKGYSMEIEYLSKKLPLLLDALDDRGLFDDSLVIILSDHGQLLGEDGKINHGTFLYDELIRVPLWVKYPWEIKHSECIDGYASLTQIRDLIMDVVKGRLRTDEILCSSVVFSEVYGTHINYSNMKLSREELERLKKLEKYRIAVYYNNLKGIFNIPEWRFEVVSSGDSSIEVSNDVVNQMKKEVIRFLKTATVAKVPKIRSGP